MRVEVRSGADRGRAGGLAGPTCQAREEKCKRFREGNGDQGKGKIRRNEEGRQGRGGVKESIIV